MRDRLLILAVVIVLSMGLIIGSIILFTILDIFWSSVIAVGLFALLYYFMWLGNKQRASQD